MLDEEANSKHETKGEEKKLFQDDFQMPLYILVTIRVYYFDLF